MACKLAMQSDLIFGFLKFALPEDTIDVELKVCTLKGSTHSKRTISPKHQGVVHGEEKCNPTPLQEKRS